MDIDTAYQILFSSALVVFCVLLAITMIRSIIGPRITDRIMSINMLGTMVISCILILTQLLHEDYLADMALIYAMISFIGVLVLAQTFIPEKKTRHRYGRHAYEEVKAEKEAMAKEKEGGDK